MSKHPLITLAASREVKQAKGFKEVASRLTGPELDSMYQAEMAAAPRRGDAGRRYLQPHGGKPPTERRKNKDASDLGAALVRYISEAGPLALPDEGAVEFFDYQVPLTSASPDRSLADEDPNFGVGRLDLLGVGPEDRMVFATLKVLEPSATRGGTGDTPLRALLSSLAHVAIAVANRAALESEVEAAFGKSWSDEPPLLLMIGTPRYWELCRKREAQKGAAWIQQMERLLPELVEHVGVEVRYVALQLEGDPGWEYGEEGPTLASPPKLGPAWESTAGRLKPKPRSRPKTSKEPEPAIIEADLSREIRSYAIFEHYDPGDRIQHPTLGLGVVQGGAGRGKIHVLFGENTSLLVHERPAAAS